MSILNIWANRLSLLSRSSHSSSWCASPSFFGLSAKIFLPSLASPPVGGSQAVYILALPASMFSTR